MPPNTIKLRALDDDAEYFGLKLKESEETDNLCSMQ